EHRVSLQGFLEGNALLQHADEKAGDDVDRGDEDRSQSVALIKASGAVHGTIEFRFTSDALTVPCCPKDYGFRVPAQRPSRPGRACCATYRAAARLPCARLHPAK